MMNATSTFFLRAKQWQIFALLAVLPMVAQMALALSMPMTVRSWKEFSRVDLLFVGAMLFYMLCFLAWLWSLGSFLNSIVKPALKLRTAFFHFSAVYPAIYMPFFLSVFFNQKPSPLAVILPLHLSAMLCIFYLLRFASKTLALAETGKPVSFYDYAGPFFLMWFYPIGVWVVQPRINRLYAERGSSDPPTTPTAG